MTDQPPKPNTLRVRNNLVEIWTGFEWIIQEGSNSVNHPLTHEQCELLSRQPWLDPDVDVESTVIDMRAAADWQLEQCVEELDCLLHIFAATGAIDKEAVPILIELFKANVRRQEDQ